MAGRDTPSNFDVARAALEAEERELVARLGPQKVAVAETEARLLVVRANLDSIRGLQQLGASAAPAAPATPAPASAEQRDPGDTEATPLAGLPYTEAIAQYLARGAGPNPQTPAEIWAGLQREGVKVAAADPARAIAAHLVKRKNSVGDVFSPGWGKWDAKAHYTPTKIRKLAKLNAGFGGDKREAHIEKTKRGLQAARQSGKRLGRPPAINVEQVQNFLRFRAEGRSIADACSLAGIKLSSYGNYRIAIEMWKPGDPWPPGRPAPELRLVK